MLFLSPQERGFFRRLLPHCMGNMSIRQLFCKRSGILFNMPRRHVSSSRWDKCPLSPEEAFGQALRNRRIALNLRQGDLEGDADLEQSYISRLERGEKQPCLRTIMLLEELLDMKPGTLIRDARKLLERT